MTDFELKRTSEIVELLENLIVEMLQSKKVNATILKCYLDLLKIQFEMNKDANTDSGNKSDNHILKTKEIIEKMLS
jgi:hypothetical protein